MNPPGRFAGYTARGSRKTSAKTRRDTANHGAKPQLAFTRKGSCHVAQP